MEKQQNPFYKPRIMTAGPTPVPEFVLGAMAASVHYHRGESFAAIMKYCREKLPQIFGTRSEVQIFSGTGTLAMEGSIANFLEPGEEIIAVNSGKFGKRWVDQAKIYGCKVHEIFVERGQAVDVEEIKKLLNENIRAILIHASETSTGVRHDVKAIAALAKTQKNCLTMVDAVTAVGVFKVPMDEWGIDVMVAGSQKGFILPPGLSFGAASERAWQKCQENKNIRYYMDWRKEKKAGEKNTGAFTSAVTLIGGLKAVLEYMDESGLDNIYARGWKLTFATREAFRSMGVKLFVEQDRWASSACTPIYTEDMLSNSEIKNNYSLMMSGGQDELKGKIIRIGHIGYMDAWDVLNQIIAVGRSFRKNGKTVDVEAGVEKFLSIVEDSNDYTPEDLRS